MPENMNKKLIVFSADGVLLNNKMSSFKEILMILGRGDEAEAIDKEYQQRKQSGPWGLEQLAQLYQGFSEDKLRETAMKYCQENLAEGAKECVDDLKEKGYTVGALSPNPQFILDSLAQNLSLDFAEGTELEFKDSIATGKIQKRVDRYIKAEILQNKREHYGLEKEDVIVVGDSITDIPMAELAGIFIGFSPKDDIVKEKATKVVANFSQLRKELL
jgi:phosphoserine phosphatase